jgi:hypothetical protein
MLGPVDGMDGHSRKGSAAGTGGKAQGVPGAGAFCVLSVILCKNLLLPLRLNALVFADAKIDT